MGRNRQIAKVVSAWAKGKYNKKHSSRPSTIYIYKIFSRDLNTNKHRSRVCCRFASYEKRKIIRAYKKQHECRNVKWFFASVYCWSLNLSHLADFLSADDRRQRPNCDGRGGQGINTKIYYHYHEKNVRLFWKQHRLNERFMVRIFSKRSLLLLIRGPDLAKQQSREIDHMKNNKIWG